MNPREINLKIISDAVAKVSDTMELKLGCRTSRGAIIGVFESEGKSLYALNYISARWPDSFSGRLYSLGQFEILGREPQLADVLLAIGENELKSKRIIGLDSEGTFCQWNDGGFKYVENIIQWNLAAGGIEHQTDETVAFIAELLK